MTWPSGRRTKHVTVYLSPAELEVWESVRAARLCPPSRADILMEWLIPECEELGCDFTPGPHTRALPRYAGSPSPRPADGSAFLLWTPC